jgi:hypothetical protein
VVRIIVFQFVKSDDSRKQSKRNGPSAMKHPSHPDHRFKIPCDMIQLHTEPAYSPQTSIHSIETGLQFDAAESGSPELLRT